MELTGEQLKKAEILLKRYLPWSLEVYGCLVRMNRAHLVRLYPINVFVDRWPEFNFIICKPQSKQEDVYSNHSLIFANDGVILEETIRKSSVIDWTTDFTIGINLHYIDQFKAVGSEKNLTCRKLAVCHAMMLEDVSNLPSIDSSGISLSSLDESHTALVSQTWKFTEDTKAAWMIRNMLVSFQSCCVLDAEAKPVSWILTYMSCAMGMLYTIPEHRGKGYAKVLVNAMARRLHAEGFPVYCFIEEENELSYKLFRKMGFVENPSVRMSWFSFGDV